MSNWLTMWYDPKTYGIGNKKKEDIQLQPDKLDFQMRTGQQFGDYINRYLPQYQPGRAYTGQRTAGMTGQEQAGLSALDRIHYSSATGPLTGLAGDEVKKTLTGGYDPATSPYYQGLRKASQINTQDAINASRRSAGARGGYLNEGSLRDEASIRQRGASSLDTILAGLYENERGRMSGAIGQAAALDEFQRAQELGQVDASQRYGGLQRIIDQADLEAQYQDFNRVQQELGQVPGQAQSLFSTPITFGMQSLPQQSNFQQLMQLLGPLVGAGIGMGVGGPAGAGVGAKVGSGIGNSVGGTNSNRLRQMNDQYLGSYYSQYLN